METVLERSYDSPVAMETVLEVLDGTAGRAREEEEERRLGLRCEEAFRWRRRLLIVSAASGEDEAYELQLLALQGQACSLGRRLIVVLKLLGLGEQASRRLIVVLKLLGLGEQAGGIMEEHGLSGNVSVETEAMSAHLVSELRSYFRLTPELYGAVLVERDGVALAWFPAPVVAVALFYELLDGGHGGGGLPPCPEHDHNYGHYGHYPPY
uniref:Coiled-coil domain-containing protein 80-like n=1 Tax=Petromyzon marinus TaxID=7757 RepID=A0AAJ7SK20_PETMA|nr:coiled-coil domain-containing protein 80-like [Petromyzon marinus]